LPVRVRAYDYRIDWRPANRYPGDHVAAAAGDGGAFRGERLLTDLAHFRRLAIRSRLRDPLSRWWVHEIQQRSAIDLVVCADVSGSMRVGRSGQMALVGDLVESSVRAVHRNGDRIGFVAAAAAIDPALSSPPARAAGRLLPIAARLRTLGNDGTAGTGSAGKRNGTALDSIDGMGDLWRLLPARRSLVLIVSDFLAPPAQWERIFATLAAHQVVPLIVEEAVDPVPVRWGLAHLTDAETGASRVLWMRPALGRRIARERIDHGERISALMARHHLRPLRLRPPFDPSQLTAYFLALGSPRPRERQPDAGGGRDPGATSRRPVRP
jgi:hypothetical protein